MDTASEDILLEVSPATKALLEGAAKLTGQDDLADYILTAAIDRAKMDMGAQGAFALSDAAWGAFNARLEAPARDLPRLRALLSDG